jgi:hypothetical protein
MNKWEFRCVECGRIISRVPPLPPGALKLCSACLMLPGWFKDAELRRRIDPDHSGWEVLEVKADGSTTS